MPFGRWIVALLGLFVVAPTFAQRSYDVKRNEEPIKLDGVLSEANWQEADVATDFIIRYPTPGENSKFKSVVKMFYDNEAVYIGAELYDLKPDSVSYTLSQRDDVGNADWFGVSIDPFANYVNGFGFQVTAAGVELDALLDGERMDYSWNAVWRSAVTKMEGGWSLEIRIPFSAIRFPNKPIQEWNINFVRSIRRNREESFWNEVDPNKFGTITQSGKLTGIKDIKSPIRLSFTPYLTGYLENSYDATTGQQTWKERLNGGMDLKYGLNDAFTLDMTLIPDFGQTVSDQQVLNLGPFEVRFNENRPFFLEGTDLFRKAGLFYSRRIGATPFRYWDAYSSLDSDAGETVVSNPSLAPLLNATKVSGRTKKGLGVGVFNAIEGNAYATIEDAAGNQRQVKTHSATNYNVFVLSQTLPNNSTISLVNTNVMRNGRDRDANVIAAEAGVFTKNQKYRFDASVKFSTLFEGEEPTLGHSVFAGIMKAAGRFTYGFGYGEESDMYNPNDLGFLYNNNSRFYTVDLGWNDFTPGDVFLRRWGSLNIYYEELYKPQLFAYQNINWRVAGTTRKFLTTGLNGSINPFGEVNHFESRTFGKEVRFNPSFSFGGFYSSDYSKRFALDLRGNWKQFMNTSQRGYSFTVSPRWRVSDRMFAVWRTTVDYIYDDYGYVSIYDDNFSDDIILGFRDRQIVENSLTTEFIFTKRMGINLQFRHYWQQVDYESFGSLREGGEIVSSDYNPLNADGLSAHNTSYNAFTIDVNYTWVFIPGSEIRLVYKNNIFNSQDILLPSYFNTFGTIFDQPQINSISLKFLVFVDVLYFRSKNRKRPK